MPFPRALACLVLALAVSLQAPVSAQVAGRQQRQLTPEQLWSAWNHYVLTARPELARGAAEALLQQADNAKLLEVVENSEYENWQAILSQAEKVEGLRETALQVGQRIQQARIGVSREPTRIESDIKLLPEGGRAYQNAVARLRGAGQFSVPQMLATLRDPGQARLHPYILRALVEMGQPVVAPLTRALAQLEPPTQAQVAQVLAETGYPMPSLPYLKQLVEKPNTDSNAKAAAQRAYDILENRSDLPKGMSSANLFLILGEAYYNQDTRGERLPGLDESAGQGIVWEYGERTGLVPVPVPQEIFGEVLAMNAAREALATQPNLDAALSLYLAANLRRENQLPEGTPDPSYPAEAQPASFYALLSGPVRIEDVLTRALRDQDAALALDAIDVLAKAAGTDVLISRGERQPLLRALSYPDQRVRFAAAQALANARPRQEFEGAFRVVPVLTEVIRPNNVRYALVLGGTQQRVNELLAAAGDQGFEAFGGTSLSAAADDLQARPNVDVIVADLDAGRMADLIQATREDYKLGSVPVVALVTRDRALSLQDAFRNERRLTISPETGDAQTLASAIEQAVGGAGGAAIAPEDQTTYALTSLEILRDIALRQTVYNVSDAEAALIAALKDERPEIVVAAGDVLALVDSQAAQQALAETALEQAGDVQNSLLASLASSGTHFGNKVTEAQLGDLLALVQESTGDTAIAAARAHGALTPPTQNAVQMIVK